MSRPSKNIDLIVGMKYHDFVVIDGPYREILYGSYKNKVFKCKCICGKEFLTISCYVYNGSVKSCGCFNRTKREKKHGDSTTRLYRIFKLMRKRCHPTKGDKYYGLRGIYVGEEWNSIEKYPNFKRWSMENGYDDSKSIERLDVNKGYFPENCTWINRKEQSKNTRRSVKFEWKGETKCLRDIVLDAFPELSNKDLHAKYNLVHYRIKVNNWNLEKALYTKEQRPSRDTTSGKFLRH